MHGALQTAAMRRCWPSATSASRRHANTPEPAICPASSSTAANAHLVTMATSVNTRSTPASATRARTRAPATCSTTTDGSGSLVTTLQAASVLCINTEYAPQICARELLETNYAISFHRDPDLWWMVPFCWQPDGRGNETE